MKAKKIEKANKLIKKIKDTEVDLREVKAMEKETKLYLGDGCVRGVIVRPGNRNTILHLVKESIEKELAQLRQELEAL